ncbi:bifunctional non-homologous end joining protein LigD [Jiangella alkaliphila]|uniref:DNA ligase (ATP) n=2 Tax=Jiangella alkaliphila TaxID=419479 RepID=A0A1H2KQ79_9ACTN|nr:bifunctional non-homologous end joining protein LigD [Jiangella alkaliphila]
MMPRPDTITPMMATLSPELPADDGGWGFEVKWDGVRTIAYIQDGAIRLSSRTLRDVTRVYPDVHGVAGAIGGRDAVLDGEVVAFDDTGRPSFEKLQSRMNVEVSGLSDPLVAGAPAVYVLFDLLYVDDRSLLNASYEERRAELDALLPAGGPGWTVPAYVPGDGAAMLAATKAQRLEGVIAKRLASRYLPGKRGRDWLKVKNVSRQEVVIGGWLPGEGGLSGSLGALAIGVYDDDGEFRYAGRVGTGLTLAERHRLATLLAPLVTDVSPFIGAQPDKPGCVFVRPELVCEVAFAEWTAIGTLRHPAYKGLRHDKPARDVVREIAGLS